MKNIKRFCIILTILLIASIFAPIVVQAADADLEITVTHTPTKMATMGGDVDFTVKVKNTGPTNITKILIHLHTGMLFSYPWLGVLNPGDTKTFSFTATFAPGDLDIQNILNVYMNNDGDIPYDGMQSKYIYVASEDNVFLSSGEVSPEQAIYYVGETVQITDRFRNSLAIAATDVSVAYYHRLTGGYLSNKNPIDLGTVAAKATAENVFDYTFTEDDIGALRIGSELTYSVSGIGPYNEFNIAHDFVVEAAPVATDTPLPSETPAPSDTPIPSDTATPTDTSETEATQAPAQEGASYTVIVTSDGASADDDDEVMFNIKVKNTGTVVLSDVKVFDGQTLLSTIGDIQVGEAVSVPITQEVSESDDKFFTVTAQYGDEKLSEYSNLIEIEVTPEEDAGTASGLLGDLFGGNNTLMVIIIGVLGLIALSLVVLVIVVVARKKK